MRKRILNSTMAFFIALGIAAWTLDTVVDTVFIYHGPLANVTSAPNAENLWHRLFLLGIFVCFGAYAGIMNSREKATAEKLRQARAFADTVFNSMHDSVSVIDAETFKIVDVNAAFLKIQGLGKEAVLGKTCHEVNHPLTPPAAAPEEPCPLCGPAQCGTYATYEHVHFNAAGERIVSEVSTSPIKDSGGRTVRVVQVARDITERKQAEVHMKKLSMVVEQTADIVVITGKDGTIEYVNPAFERITGYSREDAVGKTPSILKSGEHAPAFYRELWETILSGNVFRGVFVNRRKNGELYHDECTITPVIDGNGVITHFVATAKDITEQKLAERELRERAEKDFLTGAYNRRKFYELLARELDRALRYKRPLSLIMLDIDHFKRVNDTYGHAVGDEVLKGTTAMVREQTRDTDVLARIGGEEFVILAPETPLEHTLALAEKVRNKMEATAWPRSGKITISLGVTTYDGSATIDEFVRRADEALYLAKTSGRNRVEAYRGASGATPAP